MFVAEMPGYGITGDERSIDHGESGLWYVKGWVFFGHGYDRPNPVPNQN